MKSIVLSFVTLAFGVLAAEIPPVVNLFEKVGIDLSNYLTAFMIIMAMCIAIIIHHHYFIASYTDEYLPFQLSIVATALIGIGFYEYPRVLILGLFLLVLSGSWSRKTVTQYYPRKKN